METGGKWIVLIAVIAATVAMIYYLFVVWWRAPSESEFAVLFRPILSGIITAMVVAVEIIAFRWMFTR